jgi:phosphoenolpyruvate phosphomutase
MRKSTKLRSMLNSTETEFILEAHNAISARIVEEAGFHGIWASGLTISAQHGVRDNNELSWTQVVETLEFMSDVTSIPILVDGDTGHGDFNNMRRLVRKLEQRGIAGVCIEDKRFPKSNSLLQGRHQPLADIDEFAGKIKAGKDSQQDPDFSIIARIEALIAGWGLDEALHRAEAYRQAGADAILIHSKHARADEVLAFAEQWQSRCPLVVVPTKYYSTPTEVFRRAGVSLVIWANHLLRASLVAMQQIAAEIYESQSLIEVEGRIAPLSEIFRLQGADELLEAEKLYMGLGRAKRKAIVLAATRGDLETLTEHQPKVMVPVAGQPLLRRLVAEFKKQDVHDITVVGGYRAETIDAPEAKIVLNSQFEHSGELTSLQCAVNALEEDTVILYGDLLFRSYILRDLLHAEGELVAVVDSAPLPRAPEHVNDLAYCSTFDDRSLYGQEVLLEHVSNEPAWRGRTPCGRWVGMVRVVGEGRGYVLQALDELRRRPDFDRLGMPHLLNTLIASGRLIRVMYINGHWLDINNLFDLQRANEFAQFSSSEGMTLPHSSSSQ